MPFRTIALAAPVAALLALAVASLHARQSGPLLVQGWQNLRFAERPLLRRAIERYPKTWPPLYPLLLRAWTHAGLLPARFNLVLLYAALALLCLAARRIRDGPAAAGVTLLWAVGHFNYVNAHQPTADVLVVPLLLLLYLLLPALARGPSAGTTLAIGIVTAALLLSRYFSLFGVLPLVLAALCFAHAGSPRRLLREVAKLLALSLPPLASWMGYAYAQTGFLTGVDRGEPRHFPTHLGYWAELTGFEGDVLLWWKTLFMDFLSTRRPAVLAFVTTDYEPLALEWALAALVAVAAALGAWAVFVLSRAGALQAALRSPSLLLSPAPLAALFFCGYNGALVAVWALSNNDPLHSRYLWPAYAFLLLAFLAGREAVARAFRRDFWPALPFRLLLGLLIVVHLQRSLLVTSEPVRYELEPEPVEAAGR